MMTQNSILIAGGYGIVGQQVATFIRQRHPDLPLIIARRNPEKAKAIAQELGNVTSFQLDTEQPTPLQGKQPTAVVAVVNDPHDYLLMDAVQQGIPFSKFEE